MKTNLLTIVFILIASSSVFAKIRNSGLEERHQALIEQEVYKSCGISPILTEVFVQEEQVRIDNGIVDIHYRIQLEGKVGIDQYIYDTYKINVSSTQSAMYDHNTQNWGAYTVEVVNCLQLN